MLFNQLEPILTENGRADQPVAQKRILSKR